LFHALADAGHQATLFVGRRADTDPINVHSVRTQWERYFRALEPAGRWYDWRHVGGAVALRKVTPANYDVVHIHNVHARWLPLGSLAQLTRRVPTVWTAHDEWLAHPAVAYDLARSLSVDEMARVIDFPLRHVWAGDPWAQNVSRRLRPRLPKVEALISPSRYLCDVLRKEYPYAGTPVHQIPYGVTLSARPETKAAKAAARAAFGIDNECKLILLLAAGFHSPFKGFPLAIAALQKLNLPGTKLLVVGGLNERPDFQMPATYGGYIQDEGRLALAYRAADAFVVSSLADNFPYVVLEAMACGLPIAAFAVGGITEQLGNGERGLLARCPDTDQLAAHLRTLLTDRPLALRLASAASAWLERTCRMEDYVSANLAVYEEARARFRQRT
jgi:glycosyltransferase involved in cell wall biosynthesis